VDDELYDHGAHGGLLPLHAPRLPLAALIILSGPRAVEFVPPLPVPRAASMAPTPK